MEPVRYPPEVVDLLAAHGLPAGEVQTVDELYHSPQVAARELLMTIHDPVAGPRRVVKTPVNLSAFDPPPTNRRRPWGLHTADVLTESAGCHARRSSASGREGSHLTAPDKGRPGTGYSSS